MWKSTRKNVVQSLLCFLLLIYIACEKPVEQSESNNIISNSVPDLTEPPKNEAELSANFDNAVPPILIRKATKGGGRGRLQIYYFDLEFKSRQNDYKWLLINSYDSNPFPASGTFTNTRESKHPFSATEFSAKQKMNKVVLIRFYDEEEFTAIRLPEKGSIKFEKFQLESSSDMAEVEVWEVRSLLVNGKTPLEKWLPYDTLSEPTANPIEYQDSNRKNLNIVLDQNSNKMRSDYPVEEVEFVTAKGIRKWKIPFKLSIEEQIR